MDLRYTGVTIVGLRKMPAMKNLQRLRVHLRKDDVANDKLNDLACLKNLTTLDVSDNRFFSDLSLKEIARNTRLTSLDIHGTGISDAGLKHLAEMPNLEELVLSNSRVTNEGVKELVGLKRLRVLHLDGTDVSDAGLRALGGCTEITELYLQGAYGINMTTAGLKHLAAFKKLAKLQLGGDAVTDAGLKELAALNGLNVLDLQYADAVTDAGLKHIAVHKNLTVLDLTYTKATADGLKELADLKELQELRLLPSRVTDQHLHELRRIGMLHVLPFAKAKDSGRAKSDLEIVWLDLSGTQVSDAGLKEIAGLANLIHLDLSIGVTSKQMRGVTDEGLKQLAGMKQLVSLDLSRTKVTDAGLKELHALTSLRRLRLYLSLRPAVTDAGRSELLKALPQCRILP